MWVIISWWNAVQNVLFKLCHTNNRLLSPWRCGSQSVLLTIANNIDVCQIYWPQWLQRRGEPNSIKSYRFMIWINKFSVRLTCSRVQVRDSLNQTMLFSFLSMLNSLKLIDTWWFFFSGMTYIRSIQIDLFRGMSSGFESSTLSTTFQVWDFYSFHIAFQTSL